MFIGDFSDLDLKGDESVFVLTTLAQLAQNICDGMFFKEHQCVLMQKLSRAGMDYPGSFQACS